jgi:hypothetical protein
VETGKKRLPEEVLGNTNRVGCKKWRIGDLNP